MKVKEGKLKYYTKYKVTAMIIMDVRAQNMVILAILVLEMHFSNTVKT